MPLATLLIRSGSVRATSHAARHRYSVNTFHMKPGQKPEVACSINHCPYCRCSGMFLKTAKISLQKEKNKMFSMQQNQSFLGGFFLPSPIVPAEISGRNKSGRGDKTITSVIIPLHSFGKKKIINKETRIQTLHLWH